MKDLSRARWPWLVLVALVIAALTVSAIGESGPRTTSERARSIAESIKCPTCQGQSVADSNATAARSIRTEIARRLENGQDDDAIRDHIASLYGEEALLTPPATGVAGLIWFLPVTLSVLAIGGLAVAFARWRTPADVEVSAEDVALVEHAMVEHAGVPHAVADRAQDRR